MNNRKKIILTISLIIVAVLILLAFDRRLQTTNYTVESDRISSPVRIALVTDLHSNNYGKNASKLINAISKQSPDVVLLGGDIFDSEIPHNEAKTFLQSISAMYPCYYVTGNHEYWSDDVEELKTFVASLGITVLDGKCSTVSVKGQNLNICGIDDPVYSYDTAYAQLDSVSKASNNGYFTVLLSHRPEMVDEYARYDFDLVLSGHAHGGQFRIPYIINGVYAPNQGLFPKYAAGMYEIGDFTMIVSRGLDTQSIKLPRLFNRPELAIIDLK